MQCFIYLCLYSYSLNLQTIYAAALYTFLLLEDGKLQPIQTDNFVLMLLCSIWPLGVLCKQDS